MTPTPQGSTLQERLRMLAGSTFHYIGHMPKGECVATFEEAAARIDALEARERELVGALRNLLDGQCTEIVPARCLGHNRAAENERVTQERIEYALSLLAPASAEVRK